MSCPSSIWDRDLNQRPLDMSHLHITTRPGLPPFVKTFYLKNRPLFNLFSVFSNKLYKFYNKSFLKNVMSIQYMAPGFEPMSSWIWVISHNQHLSAEKASSNLTPMQVWDIFAKEVVSRERIKKIIWRVTRWAEGMSLRLSDPTGPNRPWTAGGPIGHAPKLLWAPWSNKRNVVVSWLVVHLRQSFVSIIGILASFERSA